MEPTNNKTILAWMQIKDFSDSSIFEHIFYSDDEIAASIYQGENFWLMESHPAFEAIKNYILLGSEVRKLTLIAYHRRPASGKLQFWQMIYRFEQHGFDMIRAVHIVDTLHESVPEVSENVTVVEDSPRPTID